MVRSFDIFDTCLVRSTALPADMFYLVGEHVYKHLDKKPSVNDLYQFKQLRIEAEQQARRNADEVTLLQIWEILCKRLGWTNPEQFASLELHIEAENLHPVPSIVELIKKERLCHPIIFISDMYLPSSFLKEVLRKHGIFEEEDRIYVSCEAGVSKHSGKLFGHVLEAEGLQAEQLAHVGDNKHSDYTTPKKLGISVELVTSTALTPVEARLSEALPHSIQTSLLVGSMRLFRLSKSANPLGYLASQVLGPISALTAAWVLRQAKADNTQRLYFVARDGQLMWKVAEVLSQHIGEIDCRYLYVSRQALYLPSTDEANRKGLSWMRINQEEPSIKRLLAKIDISYQQVEEQLNVLAGHMGENYRLKSTDWDTFWPAIETGAGNSALKQLITQRRADAQGYLTSQGIFDGTQWAVVDLGWLLTSQAALTRILKRSGYSREILGYYLELRPNHVARPVAGEAKGLFDPTTPHMHGVRPSYNCTLLEHVLGCADHPSVHHYENKKPVFQSLITTEALTYSRTAQALATSFAAEHTNSILGIQDPEQVRQIIGILLDHFYYKPEVELVEPIKHIQASYDQNNINLQPIAKPITWKDLVTSTIPANLYYSIFGLNVDTTWASGSAAISSPAIKRLVSLSFLFRKVVQRFFHRSKRLTQIGKKILSPRIVRKVKTFLGR